MSTHSYPHANRVQTVRPFLAMEVQDKAKEMERNGAHIIHFEVGEPDFATPECILTAMEKALREGHTHYTHSQGDYELRNAIARYYHKRYGVDISPEQVLVCSGTSPLMMLLFQGILNPGEEVILANPTYACYPGFVGFAGGKPVEVKTKEEDGFRLDPAHVQAAITEKTRAIFINSPANPTGIVMEKERLAALCTLAGPERIIVADEIYHGLTYGAEEHTVLEFTKHAVVIGGFSKAYAMTGFRLGYLITPPEMVRPLQILLQNFFLSPNAAVQKAGIAALEHAGPDVDAMNTEYDKRRKFMIKGLTELGFTIPVEPQGAFYLLINARHLNPNSLELAFDILEKAHIGLTPGIDFGSEAEGFLRISYANSMENLAEGLRRLGEYIKVYHS